jgi:hypothetical protein
MLAGLGQIARTEGVYRVRELRLLLAPVYIRIGRRVHDDLRRMLFARTLHGPGVGHVETPAVQGHDLMVSLGENVGQREA